MNEPKVYHHDKINFILSPKHRHALELIAADDQESMSTILRSLILKEAKRRGLWLPVPESDPDATAPPPPGRTESQVQP